MTLLTISQNIAKNSEVAQPTSIISNTSDTAKQILTAVRLATFNALKRHDWQALLTEKTFNSVASTANYDLPTDFDRIVKNSFFNTTNQQEVYLVNSSREWRLMQLNTGSNALEHFRIRNNDIYLDPTPSSAEAYVYEYISKNIVLDTDGSTTKADWAVDTDTCIVDEFLIELQGTWRFLRSIGREYGECHAEAEEYFNFLKSEDKGTGKVYPTTAQYRFPVAFPWEVTT